MLKYKLKYHYSSISSMILQKNEEFIKKYIKYILKNEKYLSSK